MPKSAKVSKTSSPARTTDALRKHVSSLLAGRGAHATFADAVKDFPAALRGTKPPGAPYSAWQLLEHMRIAQWDILEFTRDPKHVSPQWPSGYWPGLETPADEAAWDASVHAFESDLGAMRRLVANPRADLLARVRHPDAEAKHTLLREALLLADHNAYHIGELVMLRRLLGLWPA